MVWSDIEPAVAAVLLVKYVLATGGLQVHHGNKHSDVGCVSTSWQEAFTCCYHGNKSLTKPYIFSFYCSDEDGN